MGRMLDALKRADSTPGTVDEQRSAPAMLGDSTAGQATAAGVEEIPFIEVGRARAWRRRRVCWRARGPGAPTAPAGAARRSGGSTPSEHRRPAQRAVSRCRAVAARRSRFAADLVAYHAPEQPAARQYGELLDAVLNASAAADRPAALLFTSALPRTGNTMTLLNVAITAARQERRRVLVVDANLRQPGVAERLGIPAAPGSARGLGRHGRSGCVRAADGAGEPVRADGRLADTE